MLDVIGVRVRPQQVRRRQALALDELEQRAERRSAVDEDRRATRRVADDVGVRQPAARASTDRRSCVHPTQDPRAWLDSRRDAPDTRRGPSLLALALGLLGAGCLDGTETTATPDTVVGTLPATTTDTSDLPALELDGRSDGRQGRLHERRLRRLPHARRRRRDRHRRPEPRRGEAGHRARRDPGHEGHGRDAAVRRAAHRPADRGRRRVRDAVDRRLILPPSFPRDVQAFACDFDRTLVGRDGAAAPAHPRRDRALPGGRDPGDRRDRADVPLGPALPRGGGHRRARRLLPGRRRRRPARAARSSSTSRSRSRRPARRSRLLAELGHSPNCYVDDRLYVDRHTEYSRMYAEFQHLPVEEVGDLAALARRGRRRSSSPSPTRPEIPALREALAAAFGDRLFLTTSLPYLLEIGNPAVSKGTGHRLRRRAARHLARPDRLLRRRRERHRADRRGGLRDRRRGREPAAARARRLDLPERRTWRASPP